MLTIQTHQNVLKIDSELCLYLVEHGLKPAAIIGIHPNYFKSWKVDERSEFENGLWHFYNDIKPFVVDAFENQLIESNVAYKMSRQEYSPDRTNARGHVIGIDHEISYRADIGFTQGHLDALLTASSPITNDNYHDNLGIALGYPEEAIQDFSKVIDGVKRNGFYLKVNMAKAKQAGIEIPSWLAYLQHVPEQFDLVNGNVSESSEALGLEYQNFVRATNPELAKRVEKNFRNKGLPLSWTFEEDHYIDVRYNPKDIEITDDMLL